MTTHRSGFGRHAWELAVIAALVGIALGWALPASTHSRATWPAVVASAGFVLLLSAHRFSLTRRLNMMTGAVATTTLPLWSGWESSISLLTKYLLTVVILVAFWNWGPGRRHRRRSEPRSS